MKRLTRKSRCSLCLLQCAELIQSVCLFFQIIPTKQLRCTPPKTAFSRLQAPWHRAAENHALERLHNRLYQK